MVLALAALAACFSLLDAATTYMCLRMSGMIELNPFLRLLFSALGLEAGLAVGLTLRLAVISLVLAAYGRSPERSLYRSACKVILALWALVSLAASANNVLYLLAF